MPTLVVRTNTSFRRVTRVPGGTYSAITVEVRGVSSALPINSFMTFLFPGRRVTPPTASTCRQKCSLGVVRSFPLLDYFDWVQYSILIARPATHCCAVDQIMLRFSKASKMPIKNRRARLPCCAKVPVCTSSTYLPSPVTLNPNQTLSSSGVQRHSCPWPIFRNLTLRESKLASRGGEIQPLHIITKQLTTAYY